MRPVLARRYDRFTAAMEDAWLDEARRDLVTDVAGSVVEVGAGTGKNLPHQPHTVTSLVLTEPVGAMRSQLHHRIGAVAPPFPVEVVDATADDLPMPDGSVDVVVSTLVLCSVPSLARAASELARVLRPGGELRLIEHVAAESPRERKWQRRLDRPWAWLEGSCHLDHDTPAALATAGFDVSGLERTTPRGQPPLFRDIVIGIARRP